MTLTLLTISIFVIFNIVINTTTESIREKIDLAVYFKTDTTEEQVHQVENILKYRPNIKSITFVSKDEALKRWQSMKISDKVKDQVSQENNPLPFSLDIKTTNPEYLKDIDSYITNSNFANLVERISYQENKDIVERLVNITNFSRKLGIILGIIFIVVSILVIQNTVRLAIYTRTKEIEIMRLVGASDAYIRIPFVIEAILYALLATIISLIIIWIGLLFVSPMVSRYLGDINLDMQGFFFANLWKIFLLELFISCAISISCSFLAMRKHLKI